jgi:glycerophosphoryl diester phosphodiesterase
MGRVENTLPAFAAAIARDFAIECDVRATSDGEVVVFHDDTLERLTGMSGAVARRSLADVRTAHFRTGDARIPTLDELLDLVDGRVPLMIELKEGHGSGEALVHAVAAVLSMYSGPVAVMSFAPGTMVAMRRTAPQLPRGMVIDDFSRRDYPTVPAMTRLFRRHLLSAPLVLPQFVACQAARLPAAAPLLLRHFFDLPLLGWTVRSREAAKAAREWVDQIIFEGFDPVA